MDESRIRLACGDLAAEIAPRAGGALACLRAGGLDLLRPELRSGPGAGRAPGMACFPMVPFCNRIARGRFEHGGRSLQVPCNVPEPHPLHGHGWQSAWTVAARDERSARLEFAGDSTAWPWPYLAFEEFTLEPDAIAVTLGLRSLAAEPFPFSIGLHPYFLHRGSARLEARVERVWGRDAEGIPTEPHRLTPGHGFDPPRPLGPSGLDHCYEGWTGRATVTQPELGLALQLEARNCGFLHVYAPIGEDYFCAEPMNARPDAFNPRPGDRGAVPLLAPRASAQMQLRLRVERLPADA